MSTCGDSIRVVHPLYDDEPDPIVEPTIKLKLENDYGLLGS